MLVDALKKAATRQISVVITEMVGDLISNITYRMLFGQQTNEQIDIALLVIEHMQLIEAFNIADYVPVFGALDLQVKYIYDISFFFLVEEIAMISNRFIPLN